MIRNDGKRMDQVLDRLGTASFKAARRAYALLLLLHGGTVPLGLSISQELMEPCVYGVPCRRSMGGLLVLGVRIRSQVHVQVHHVGATNEQCRNFEGEGKYGFLCFRFKRV